MSGAIKFVISGKMGINRAADQYGVPRSTLKDRVSGRHGTRSGPQPYLSYEEEEELVTYLIKCVEIGYPKTKDESFNKPFTRRMGLNLPKSLEERAGGRDLSTGG